MLEADPLPLGRSRWHRVLRLVGAGCLMLAFALGGYVGWLLWGTGLQTAHAQEQLRTDFHPDASPPAGVVVPPLPGHAYAELTIPSVGIDVIVVQGVDTQSLKAGPGHYPGTANPWDTTGRVGLAGHRTTYLHPFYNLDSVKPGDLMTLRTAHGTYVYRVTKVFVIPSEGSGIVLTQTRQPTLVLTTCTPRFSASHRLIVAADRVAPAGGART
jgi:sortase A